MKRKLTNRNKDKYSKLVKWAREEDLGLHNLLQALMGLNEIKHSIRIANRHGKQEDWDAVDLSAAMITVPVVSCKDGKVLEYSAYFSKDMLPGNKKEQYGVHFDDSSTAEGMLTNINPNDSVTDEETRDDALGQI